MVTSTIDAHIYIEMDHTIYMNGSILNMVKNKFSVHYILWSESVRTTHDYLMIDTHLLVCIETEIRFHSTASFLLFRSQPGSTCSHLKEVWDRLIVQRLGRPWRGMPTKILQPFSAQDDCFPLWKLRQSNLLLYSNNVEFCWLCTASTPLFKEAYYN